MKAPKFNFVPERQLEAKANGTQFRVNLYKNGVIVFNREDTDVYELDGKFFRVYIDAQNKTIGWSVIDGKTNLEALKDARQLNKVKAGYLCLSVGKLLKRMGYPKGFACKGLEVKKYSSSLMGNEIYYVTLPEAEVKTS